MSEGETIVDSTSISALYAGFARAFRYPGEGEGALSAVEYLQVFDPAVGAKASSLHEASYVDTGASALFEELVRFYGHFGLQRSDAAELPDHLTVELEFMQFLCELEGEAEHRGDDIESVRAAQRDFLDRHVLRLLRGLFKSRVDKSEIALDLTRSCVELVESHRLSLAVAP